MYKILMLINLFISFSVFADIKLPVVNGENTAPLGKGYNKETDSFRGECVKGSPIYIGKQESNFGLSQSLSQAQLSSELGFDAGFKARTGVTTHKGSAKFLRTSVSNSFSLSTTFSSSYAFKDTYLSKPMLTSRASEFLQNPEQFKKYCGDNFLERTTYGAKLFYNIKIEFASKKSKESFSANYSFNGSFASAYANLKNNRSSFSTKTSVKFSAVQIGGDIPKLTALLGGSSSPDSGTAYSFVECSFGNFSKCDEVMKDALDYATNTESGFPSQLKQGEDMLNSPNGPAALEYTVNNYETLGIFLDIPRELTFMIKSIRKRLSSIFDELFTQGTKVEGILSSSVVRLTPEQRDHFLSMKNDLDSRVGLVAMAIRDCFDSPLSCEEIRSNLLEDSNITKVYEDQDFEIEKINFAQFCDFSKSIASSKELRTTVNALVKKAKTIAPDLFEKNSTDVDVDECFASQTAFEQETSVDLSGLGLIDIRPLGNFKHFIDVNLSKNIISNLTPLLNLRNLERLNLGGNNLTSIHGMKNLERLSYLNLSTNDLVDVSELSELYYLTKLDVRNNKVNLACPLLNEASCISFDIRGRIQSYAISSSKLEVPRLGHQSILLGKSVLTLGGIYLDEMTSPQAGFGEIYNANEFNYQPFQIGDLNKISYVHHKMLAITDSEFLVVGGVKNSLLRHFKSVGGKIHLLQEIPLGTERVDHQLVRVGNQVHIIGGWTKKASYWSPRLATKLTQIYDINAMTISAGPSLNIPRAGHTATLLNDGRILVVGGFNLNGDSLNTAEIYDSNSRVYTVVNSFMKVGRAYAQAVLAQDGRVVLIGGYQNNEDATNSIEMFDPSINIFIKSTELMNYARGDHQVNLLSSGHILIAGGAKKFNVNNKDRLCEHCLDTLEVYDPVTQTVTLLKTTLIRPLANFSMMALDNNKILVVGGAKDYLRDEIYSLLTIVGLE